MNPLMGMMGGAAPPGNGPVGMLQQIRQFAGLVGSRDPQQMVRNLIRQKGISDAELQQTMQQAREIARMMGMR